MFRGMYPIFWIGLLIMYSFAILTMLVEMITNTGTVEYSVAGIPVPFIYVMFLMVWIVPMAVALLWYWVPKRSKARRDRGREG